MKVAIVGSRNYPELDKVREYVRSLPNGSTVVSGGAKGVDKTAEDAAKECGLGVISLKPDWKKYGRGAGIVRNKQIVETADEVVAFWDGKSRGTMNTVDTAKKLDKPVKVII